MGYPLWTMLNPSKCRSEWLFPEKCLEEDSRELKPRIFCQETKEEEWFHELFQ